MSAVATGGGGAASKAARRAVAADIALVGTSEGLGYPLLKVIMATLLVLESGGTFVVH